MNLQMHGYLFEHLFDVGSIWWCAHFNNLKFMKTAKAVKLNFLRKKYV